MQPFPEPVQTQTQTQTLALALALALALVLALVLVLVLASRLHQALAELAKLAGVLRFLRFRHLFLRFRHLPGERAQREKGDALSYS